MKNKPYFLVWNETTKYTAYKHESRLSAEVEAQRLAKENRGHTFVVLAPVRSFTSADLFKIDFDYSSDDEIPF